MIVAHHAVEVKKMYCKCCGKKIKSTDLTCPCTPIRYYDAEGREIFPDLWRLYPVENPVEFLPIKPTRWF